MKVCSKQTLFWPLLAADADNRGMLITNYPSKSRSVCPQQSKNQPLPRPGSHPPLKKALTSKEHGGSTPASEPYLPSRERVSRFEQSHGRKTSSPSLPVMLLAHINWRKQTEAEFNCMLTGIPNNAH